MIKNILKIKIRRTNKWLSLKKNSIEIGDIVQTTVIHENFAGYFEIGTAVKVINIGPRGYDIQDKDGNRITEIGWTI